MLKRKIFAAAFVVCLSLWGDLAQAAEIRVLCSNGLRAVVEDIRPAFEKASGHTLALQFSSTATLKQRIESGEAFDVALLTTDVIEDLIKSGKLVASSRSDVARSGIGVGFRKGGARPDVRTAAALKASLLNAKSLAYTRDGASRATIDRMLGSLGIGDTLGPRTNLLGPGQAPESVAKGESELVITLVSEILPVAGVELAGPLPSEFQNYVTFTAAASPRAGNTQGVQAFVAFLDGPSAAAAFKTRGMDGR